MGQKVNPHGLRVGVIKDWDSRWYANKADFGDTLVEDYNVRNFIKKSLYAAGVPRIEIERFADKVRIHIHCAKPGIVIGRQGAEIEKLRVQLEKMMGKQVFVNIIEVKQPDMDAQLVAEKIALDLENRVSFRRAMKQSIGRTMRLGARVSRLRFPADLLVLKSQEAKATTRVQSRFRQSALISITVSLRLIQHTASSA